jgi:hypothetical protein
VRTKSIGSMNRLRHWRLASVVPPSLP